MKHSLAVLSMVSSVLLVSACSFGGGNQNPPTESSSSSVVVEQPSDDVVVTAPQPNDTITSPLTVTGEARGTWYFEASFPIKLFDGNGNQIAAAPATAQGDWMTTDFVPFTATFTYQTPATPTGYLLIEKDNPSGLPENAASITVPVQF